jgi:uncharacterized membrane protein YedE/YeeE
MQHFTPLSALAGGALIGLGASILLLVNGRIAGVSGIVAGLVSPLRAELSWRALFLAGLVLAGVAGTLLHPASFGAAPHGIGVLALAGFLVGLGTRLSVGCTSGHGVCGISRFSLRSLLATVTFVGTGILTVTLLRVWGAGS